MFSGLGFSALKNHNLKIQPHFRTNMNISSPLKNEHNIFKTFRITHESKASFYQGIPNIIPQQNQMSTFHATTVLTVRKKGKVVVISDGQVTRGDIVLKSNAKKVRRIGQGENVIVGFAGSAADALTLMERLEIHLEKHPGQLQRACIELAKLWRMDKYLRRLAAEIVVCDKDHTLHITGSGDVNDVQDGVIAIGSGGPFAFASAKALIESVPEMDAEEIAQKSMRIAADLCIYTNRNFSTEILTYDPTTSKSTL